MRSIVSSKMATNTQFKIFLKKNESKLEIRRCILQSEYLNNFEYVKTRIVKLFPDLTTKSFSVFWNDEEDNIIISSDEELVLALSSMKGKIKKLFIEINPLIKRGPLRLSFSVTPPKVVVDTSHVPAHKMSDLPAKIFKMKENIPPAVSEYKQMVAPIFLKKSTKPVELTISPTEECCISSTMETSDNTEIILNKETLPGSLLKADEELEQKSIHINDVIAIKADTENNIHIKMLKNDLSLIVHDLLTLTEEINSQFSKNSCQEIQNNISEIPQETDLLDQNIEKLMKVKMNLIDLKKNLISDNESENQLINSTLNDLTETLSIDKTNENISHETSVPVAEEASEPVAEGVALIDFEVNSPDCGSVKTISETSESLEERWTLLNLDLDNDTAIDSDYEAIDALKLENECATPLNLSVEKSIYPNLNNVHLQDNDSIHSKSEEPRCPVDPTPNMDMRAIFPNVAAALRLLGEMGFDTTESKFLLLAELYDGDIPGILESMFF